jgi:hypothetical protein
MLSQSAKEAAFLTAAGNAPRLGEQLELTPSRKIQALAEGATPATSDHLPRFGRVVRLGKPDGTTRRVAIQFE